MSSCASILQARIHFITLGCAKNEVDTFHMRNRVTAAGFSLVEDSSFADVIVINTCSFIQSATEESLEAIFDAADLPMIKKGEALLVVAGCMPARYGNELQDELQEVKTFIPCSKEDDIVEIIQAVLNAKTRLKTEKNGCVPTDGIDDRYWPTPSAYVKISEGCDRFCTYCAIPMIRGPYWSFKPDSIEREVASLIEQGIREIVLVAQDSGRWGLDLPDQPRLSDLLDLLATKHPNTWFRVMYIQPEGVTDELLSVVDSHDNICPYFDIPLQHVDEDILEAMNRSGSMGEYLELVERMRSRVRNVALRTTLIAGFPGESEEAHQKLCDFLEEAEFDYVGVFPYSAEEGTEAASYENQLSDEVKAERAQQLRDIADTVSFSRIEKHVGNRYPVLMLGREEDGQLYGRTQQQAPDVDGVVYADKGEVGSIVMMEIVDTVLYELEGESCD
ncbi:MAG: 30S ribosomal protein S12 methylthiotransferase RimO [Raoultibacter sp.]|jgi:ribosomal protein S12 methylthiotransferase